MKKMVYVFSLILMFLFVSLTNVNAEEIKDDNSCSYASKAHLNKLAGSVKASYAFKTEKDGSISFDISIYNITDDIYVSITNSSDDYRDSVQVFYSMTEKGTYTFNVKNIETITTYKIEVRTIKFGCTGTFRTLTVVKPKKNNLSDLMVCRYEEVVDYIYCQKWITNDFNISENRAIDRIIEERQRRQTTTTSKCISCEIEKENASVVKEFNRLKLYLIIGLSLGIVVDLAVMMLLIYRIKRYDI